jgi:hypothetical protein
VTGVTTAAERDTSSESASADAERAGCQLAPFGGMPSSSSVRAAARQPSKLPSNETALRAAP